MFEIIMLLGFLFAAVTSFLPDGNNASDQQKAKRGKCTEMNHGGQKTTIRRGKTIKQRAQATFARERPGRCLHEGMRAA